MKVLLLGAAGRLGQVLTRELGDSHDFALGDIAAIDDPRSSILDVCDYEAVERAVEDCDLVINLAITRDEDHETTTGISYADAAFDVHVKGCYHVLRAAVKFGNKRVVHAGSVSAFSGYDNSEFITSAHCPECHSVYGMTKGFGEEMCRLFHEAYGLPITVLRLGRVVFETVEDLRPPGTLPFFVHEDDVAAAFACVLQQPTPDYAVIHVVADNIGRRWDLDAAWRLYRWQPTIRFDENGTPFRD